MLLLHRQAFLHAQQATCSTCILQLLALYVAGGIAGSLAHVGFFYFTAQGTGMPCDTAVYVKDCQDKAA